jgi:voltage-gated potassium channel
MGTGHDRAVSDVPEPKLPGKPRSPEDAAALARFDSWISLPLVLAAILPIILMPGSTRSLLAAAVDIASWIVFLVDYVVHERRLRHYTRTWLGRFDLSVVILTAPWFLLFGPGEAKFVMVIRLARVARLVMATRGARRLFERLGRVALVAALVVFLGAAVAYGAEHPTNPGFATYGDALWWGVVTLTTVGYGDIVPKTTTGRVAGIMIMFTGVGVLGVLAGSLASFFRLPSSSSSSSSSSADSDAEPGSIESDTARAPDALAREVAVLREQITGLSAEIARLGPIGNGSGDERGLPPSDSS